jgi:hypothetical protein
VFWLFSVFFEEDFGAASISYFYDSSVTIGRVDAQFGGV